MFKIMIFQRYYNLSDDQVEYQLNDRMVIEPAVSELVELSKYKLHALFRLDHCG